MSLQVNIIRLRANYDFKHPRICQTITPPSAKRIQFADDYINAQLMNFHNIQLMNLLPHSITEFKCSTIPDVETSNRFYAPEKSLSTMNSLI
jgi:hypothetical protein